MAKLTLSGPLDLRYMDLFFPVGGTPTTSGFSLQSGTGWQIEVALTGMDIATDFDLFQLSGGFPQERVVILDVNRPVVYPIGGTIQSLLSLVLDGKDTLTGSSGDDSMSGYKGADVLRGLTGADNLAGAGGADLLFGGSGQDKIFGGGGNDKLHGNAGNDVLRGGNGDDVLQGGRGDDRLWGGTGTDKFVFRRGDGQDTISDFEVGTDLIQIGKGAANIGDLTFSTLGTDVVVSFANVDITVQDVTIAEMNDSNNFLF
jgi:Ca2+-binding RTX toxin-like protein